MKPDSNLPLLGGISAMLPLAELISFTGQNSNLHGCRLYEISFYRIFWFILDEFVANVCLYLPCELNSFLLRKLFLL